MSGGFGEFWNVISCRSPKHYIPLCMESQGGRGAGGRRPQITRGGTEKPLEFLFPVICRSLSNLSKCDFQSSVWAGSNSSFSVAVAPPCVTQLAPLRKQVYPAESSKIIGEKFLSICHHVVCPLVSRSYR